MKTAVFRSILLLTIFFYLSSVVWSDDKKTPTPMPFPTTVKSTPSSSEKPEKEGSTSKGSEGESKKNPTPIGTIQGGSNQGGAGGNGNGGKTYPPIFANSTLNPNT